MSHDARYLAARASIVDGLKSLPLAGLRDEALVARLDDPGSDCRFAEFGMDSLAQMELCIFVECETGVAVSVGELDRLTTIGNMARHIEGAMGRED